MPTENPAPSTPETATASGGSRVIGNMAARIALVTGANKGIGFEIARQLGECGMTVYVGARDSSRGTAAAERLQENGITARFVELDVLREETDAPGAIATDFSGGMVRDNLEMNKRVA